MACKLIEEMIDQEFDILESMYSGKELEAKKALAEKYITNLYSANEKTIHLNENYYKPGDRIRVVDNTGDKKKSYPIVIDSIKYNANGEIETVSRKKDGSTGAVFITTNGYTKNGIFIDALNELDEKILDDLGSSQDSLSEEISSDFEKQQVGILNDPKKSIELFDELVELDDVNISDNHKSHLKNVLSTFTDSASDFIPAMHVYLNKEAEKNGGFIKFKGLSKGLYVNVGTAGQYAGNQMSSAEAFVHETIHAATEYARVQKASEVSPIVNRLQKLHEQAIRHLTVEDLMPEFSIYDEIEEKKIAQATLDYIKSKNGLPEFVALGLTNEKVMNKLNGLNVYEKSDLRGKKFFEVVLELLGRLFDFVMRRKRFESGEITSSELLAKLSLQLAEANNNALKAKRKKFFQGVEGVSRTIDKINNAVSKTIKNYEDSLSKKKFPRLNPNSGKFGKTIWTLKNAWRLMNDPKTRPYFEGVMSSAGFKPEDSIQTILRGFRDQDGLQLMLEKLGLSSSQIDRHRENSALHIGNMILAGFAKKPNINQQNSLTVSILDTDISSIEGSYDIEDIGRLLSDESYLDNERAKARLDIAKSFGESKVKKRDSNYYISQSIGLGYYMATHKASPTQLLNAENIAIKLNSTDVLPSADPKLVEMIDRLATLESIKYTPSQPRQVVSDLIKSDSNGVKNFIAYHSSFKDDSDVTLFAGDKKINKIKGYTKEIFDQDITMRIAPISEKDGLLSDGFDLVEVLTRDKNDNTEQQMAIYINNDHVTQSFNRVGMRLTDQGRRGTSLKDARSISGDDLGRRQAALDIRRVNSKVLKDIEAMHENIVEPGIEYADGKSSSLVPVFDEYGVATDYRYMMSKARKAKLLNQDVRGPLVLGRMHASIKDKEESKDFNVQVVDTILDDMSENFNGEKFGNNSKEYIVVDENSNNKDIRELWRIIPKTVKLDLQKRRGKITQEEIDKLQSGLNDSQTKGLDYFRSTGKIAVRRDLLSSYFGFRDMSIVDTKMAGYTPRTIKHLIRLTEMLWKELVKIAKVDIIIRTPAVLIGNIVSNFVLSVQFGMNPLDVLRLQIDGVRELKKYNDWNKELIQLEAAKKAGNLQGKNIDRIELLTGYMQDSAVRDLIDAGLFQAIVEDANVEDLKASSRFVRKIDEKLVNAPAFMRTGFNYLYMTERTLPFKVMTTATQYSDFVARYALYNSMKNKGMKRDVALQKVTDAFINYGAPDSKLIQYLNDMGLVMFTKYFLRIQRVIRTGIADHPVNFLLALLAQEFILGDTDDITDQSIFTKNYTGIAHSPADIISNAFIPTSAEFVADAYRAMK